MLRITYKFMTCLLESSRSSAADDADSKVEDLEVEASVNLMIQGTIESRVLGCDHWIKTLDKEGYISLVWW